MSDPIDLQRVVREIEEEVRRKRATGELPASLEQRLDLDFARYAPAGAAGTDLEQVLARVEQRSHIDANPPLTSSQPGFSQVKRVLRKMMRWYVRSIAEQTSAFASAITRALNLLTQRVKRIEQIVDSDDVLRIVQESYGRNFRPDSETIDVILDAFSTDKGRVLHALASDGWLVDLLRQRGVDVYGIEPTLSLADEASARSLDVRPDDLVSHLESLKDDSIDGLILSGFTDYETVGTRSHILNLCCEKLAAGGTISILSAQPEVWAEKSIHVVCDLASGQPFLSDTWQALLESQKCSIEKIEQSARSYVVLARKPVSDS